MSISLVINLRIISDDRSLLPDTFKQRAERYLHDRLSYMNIMDRVKFTVLAHVVLVFERAGQFSVVTALFIFVSPSIANRFYSRCGAPGDGEPEPDELIMSCLCL